MICKHVSICPTAVLCQGGTQALSNSLVMVHSVVSQPALSFVDINRIAGGMGIVLPQPVPTSEISGDRYAAEVALPLLAMALRSQFDNSIRNSVLKTECPIGAFFGNGLADIELPDMATFGIMSHGVLHEMYEELGRRECGTMKDTVIAGALRLVHLRREIERASVLSLDHPELRSAEVSRKHGIRTFALRHPIDLTRGVMKYVVVDTVNDQRDIRLAESDYQHVMMVNHDIGERVVGAGFATISQRVVIIDGDSGGLRTTADGIEVNDHLVGDYPVQVSADAGMDSVYGAFKDKLDDAVVVIMRL